MNIQFTIQSLYKNYSFLIIQEHVKISTHPEWLFDSLIIRHKLDAEINEEYQKEEEMRNIPY